MIFKYTRCGDRHIHRSVPCDDSVAAVKFGKYSALVLSDGCSSSVFGGDSARRITNRIIDKIKFPASFLGSDTDITGEDIIRFCLQPDNAGETVRLLLNELDKEVIVMCDLYQCQRKDVCCTLIIAFIGYDPKSGNNTATVITIGDGFVVACSRKHKGVTLISRGENRNNHPNMTYFCTSENAVDHAHIYRVNAFDELMISSDGVTHAIDIDDSDELSQLLHAASSGPGITDADFSEKMDRLLNEYVWLYPIDRDLNDDCGVIYYTTDKRSIRRLFNKSKNHI